MFAYLVVIVVLAGVVLAIRLFMKRSAAHRAAHDARMRAMAQATIAALKKKQAAQTATPTPPAPEPVREERECPWCAEPILKKARVCKHCGREVEPYSQSV